MWIQYACFLKHFSIFLLTCLARVIHRSLSQLHKLEELDLGNNELYSLVRFFCFNPEECQKHNFSLCLVLVMSEQISIPREQLSPLIVQMGGWPSVFSFGFKL